MHGLFAKTVHFHPDPKRVSLVKCIPFISSEKKFSVEYLIRKLQEMYNVHISRAQCFRLLRRVHGLIIPSTKALITTNARIKRCKVSFTYFSLWSRNDEIFPKNNRQNSRGNSFQLWLLCPLFRLLFQYHARTTYLERFL